MRSSQGAGDLLYLTGKRTACGRERPGFQTASICASHLPDRRLPCKEQITLIPQRNRSTHYEDPTDGRFKLAFIEFSDQGSALDTPNELLHSE
jgi:hypothetical protein